MSESHALVPTGDIDSTLTEILKKAKYCWLSPPEICVVLDNYTKFVIDSEPPHKPKGGSLFLFNKNVLRNFRKDGHSWNKRKDGKSVMECHEKLKAGNVEVLQCYYVRGEDNENFQRRCYWLLQKERSNIVLVHYHDVKGNRANYSRVREGGEAIPNSLDIEVVPNSEVVTSLSSTFNPHRYQVTPQTTNIASLVSSQASQYADAKLEESQGQGTAFPCEPLKSINLSQWDEGLGCRHPVLFSEECQGQGAATIEMNLLPLAIGNRQGPNACFPCKPPNKIDLSQWDEGLGRRLYRI